MGKSIDEKLQAIVRKAEKAARDLDYGERSLSVEDFEERVEQTKKELIALEQKRSQAEVDMGNMLSNGASETIGNEALAKINKIEVKVRKARAILQSHIMRLGKEKRELDLYNARVVRFIELFGVEAEELFCRHIQKSIKDLAKTAGELNSFKAAIDQARYETNGSRQRPNHVAYSIVQSMIFSGLDWLHLGTRNRSFYQGDLYRTLHPSASDTHDAIPPSPILTDEDREAKLKELIEQKHAEVREKSLLEDEQEQANQDETVIVEEQDPLPAGAHLIVENTKKTGLTQ